MTNTSRKSEWTTGWCGIGSPNHDRCTGSLRTPGSYVLCRCKCHKGQKIEPPAPEPKKAYVPGSRNPEQLAEFVAKLGAYGKVSWTPEGVIDPDEVAAIKARMHNAARKAGVSIRIKTEGSTQTATVVKTPKRKKR